MIFGIQEFNLVRTLTLSIKMLFFIVNKKTSFNNE